MEITQEKAGIRWVHDKLFYLFATLTFVYALCMPDRNELFAGYLRILTTETHLTHDFFAVGGLSATYLNVATHFLVAALQVKHRKEGVYSGLQLAGVGIFSGHAFFGTHIVNMIPLMLGVFLYSHWIHQSFRYHTVVALFSASLSPVISYILFHHGISTYSVIIAIVAGLALGFIAVPLSEHFVAFHQGFTLYNFGFTAGIIAMFSVLFINYLHQGILPEQILSSHGHHFAVIYVLILLLIKFILAFSDIKEIKDNYKDLLKDSGRSPADFTNSFGMSTTMFNMALMGLIYLFIILMTGFPINGPIIGGLFSVIGFSAFGKHPKNTLPIALGVTLGAYYHSEHALSAQNYIMPLLFGTGLAPLSGYFGFISGIIAGFLQYNLANTVLMLHLGMNLYNNGFTSGFVAGFLVPIYDSIIERPIAHLKQRKKQKR